MTRRGTVLAPVTELVARFEGLIDAWNAGVYALAPFPRSLWLRDAENELRGSYPGASSRDLNVTARALAPFPLAEHDW